MALTSNPNAQVNDNNFLTSLGQGMLGAAAEASGIRAGESIKQNLKGWNIAGGSSGSDLYNNISQLNILSGQLANETAILVSGTRSLIENDWNDTGEKLTAAGTALWEAGSAVGKKFIEERWERLQSLLKTKQKVKIGSLIGEAAPYAKDFSAAAKALGQKAQNLISYLLNIDVQTNSNTTWGEFGEMLAYNTSEALLNDLSSDPATQQAVAQLGAVPGLQTIMTTADTILKTVKTVLKIVDTLKPTLRIIKDLALSYWSGGTSTAEAAQEIEGLVMKILMACGKVALGILRKYIYDLELDMPVLIIQSIKVLSVKEAVKTMDKDGFWYNFLFSEDYAGASQTLSKWRSWMDTISAESSTNNIMLYAQTYMAVAQDALAKFSAENSLEYKNSSWNRRLLNNSNWSGLAELLRSDSAGSEYLRLFSNNFTRAYMEGAATRARAKLGILSFEDPGTQSTSYDSGDTSNNDESAGNTLNQILNAMAAPGINWTETLIQRTSKQVYDKI